MKIERHLRESMPAKAKRADHARSRSAAIDLHCQACCGGSREGAKKCTIYSCFLYPFGLAVGPRLDGAVPTVAEYDAMLATRPKTGFAAPVEPEE